MSKQNLSTRTWIPSSYDPEARTVQGILATERPVKMHSFEHGQVDEILLMSGVVLPDSGQVPLLDTHSRHSTGAVLGSVREIHVDGSDLVGVIHFADDQQGRDVAAKVWAGHLTDFSAGYRILEASYIPEGQTTVVEGREFTGPVSIVTSWKLMEASLCPIGADSQAKTRSEENTMTTQTQTKTTAQDSERAAIINQERERVAGIMLFGQKFDLPDMAQRLIQDGTPAKEAVEIMARMSERLSPANSIRAQMRDPITDQVISGGNRHGDNSAAIVDGLLARAGVKVENPAPGHEDYRHATLVDIARMTLAQTNSRAWSMSAADAVREALSQRMHSTSDFPSILSAFANKNIQQQYMEAPSTFEKWTTKASAPDFKTLRRLQLSTADDLEQVNEGAEYSYGTFGEREETYTIAKYGKLFKVTMEAIQNDDLAAFTRVQRAFVQSAKRKLNGMVYEVLSSSQAMSDSEQIFSAAHGNLADSGSGLSIESLAAAFKAMRTQSGGSNGYPLGIQPTFLIVPAALEADALQLIETPAGYDATAGHGVSNPFYKRLEVIVDPALDLHSVTAWYVAANPGQFEGIEVAYLNGVEMPYLEERQGWEIDSWEFKIRHSWGVGVLDWRGLYKNAGASG